ncbi:MAG: beta-ketoacyl-ACP synthase III [Pseudomonadota bacterium]|uniref:beta-ketoacyl-ACP synthase III n=1 Tax=Fodinicurvata fenggangensis TaxID=1121830 RepID=UPI00047DC2B5|nr:beta-ketoacyl-ACP synthase III [Fodinicurvata fenggangensis]
MQFRSHAIGGGSYLPSRVVTNADLEKTLDTTDSWIRDRTGIAQRHVAADGEMTSDLAVEAARKAMENADVSAAEIDLIICATSTPDETFPATATRVQYRLGIRQGAAFDVQAVCSGFVYALAVADNFIRTGMAKNVLVIGAETFSRILDWTDRGTCVLFGDGAGALLLQSRPATGEADEPGILSTHIYSDGQHHDALYVDGGPSSTGTVGHLRMQGREVFRHAVVRMSEAVDAALEENGLKDSDIDWLVPHQANVRIIESMAKRLGLPTERVVVSVDRHANTSAASIPLALCEAVEDGRISKGDLILMDAMGGGFTWGSALLRW